jgi:hypothetical protein
MNWILTANLFLLWSVGECLAISIGLHGISLVFEKRQTQYALLRGAFPLLFGAVSLIWFSTDSNLRGSSWWLYALAAVPLLLGLAIIFGSCQRPKP